MKKPLSCFFCFFLYLSLHAQDSVFVNEVNTPAFTCNGYIKSLQSGYIVRQQPFTSLNLIHNRINMRYQGKKPWEVKLELRNRLFFGEQVSAIQNFAAITDQQNGLIKLSHVWTSGMSVVAHSSVERAFFKYAAERWDVRIGRQRINWGISNIWNVNDIFNTYNFLDFDFEERAGTDAVRIQYFVNGSSSVELAASKSAGENASIMAAMYKWNRKLFDYQCFGGIYHTDVVAGFGWAGSCGKFGFKGESSYFQPFKKSHDSTAAWLITVMVDRTVGNNWYVSGGALFQSYPPKEMVNALGLYGRTVTARAIFPFPFSTYATASWQSGGATSFQLTIVYAPRDHTILCLPVLTWNAAENIDIDLIGQTSFSKSPAFGHQATGIYLRSRWSY